jgi:predicted RNase H-like HicB family nuclease
MSTKGVSKIDERIAEILEKPYARILIKEDGGYVASILEFPNCVTEGDSLEDAMSQLEDAMASWVEAALEMGQDIPEPFENSEYSGRLTVRLPRSIHKSAALKAASEGISLNQLVVLAVTKEVGA